MKKIKEIVSLIQEDCLQAMGQIESESIDLIYLDPPFLTQKIQKLTTKDRKKEFSFNDFWKDHEEYAEFLYSRILKMHDKLKKTGSIFVHCDKNATHIVRLILDEVFGKNQFVSEIIWCYRRWSNSKKGLLPLHQNILFYPKTEFFKFNHLYADYSEATNVDQILQGRVRDKHGKSVYAREKDGSIIPNGAKKGVPLGDVWDIPYLNPKAKERAGYPTQKPILLLEQIIKLTTDKGDIVLDPFCGSGTTLVAADRVGREFIGIDISEDAIKLSEERLNNPIKTESNLLSIGRQAYKNVNEEALAILTGLDYIPVHRNIGIDAFIKSETLEESIPIRVQRKTETLFEAIGKLIKAIKDKGINKAILISTGTNGLWEDADDLPENIIVIDSTANSIHKTLVHLGLINASKQCI